MHTGVITKPPVPIKPWMRESMMGHKTSNAATGCVGTVSWTLGDTNKMLVVAYSVPYSHDLHSNYLSVGIFDEGSTEGFYNKMLYKSGSNFERKEFYHDVTPLEYQDDEDGFGISASMGSNHKAEIIITITQKKVAEVFKNISGN